MRDRATFARLSKQRRVRQGPLSLVVLPAPPDAPSGEPPRVAYTIGKRVGPAVTRNRVRRRLRSSVRSHAGRLRPGAAYLFGAAPSASTISFAQLDDAVERLLEKAQTRT